MKKLSKLITWPLVFIFLHQNIGWAASTDSVQFTVNSLQSYDIHIPEFYGRIERNVNCKQYTVNSSPTQVVLVKDAHCNYEAQTNIAKILDILIRDYKIDLIGEEGASGHINPSIVLESDPKEEIRKDVSDKFLKNGLLVASEALSINKGREPGFTIWGIEDLRLYLEDYKAFRDTFGTNSTGKHFIELLSKTIDQLKNRIYPEGLQEFDRIVKGYESNKTPLSRFIKVLYYNYGIPKGYKNLKLILKSIRLEEEIDFNKVERERTNLIKELEKTLPKEDLQELIKQSLLYKLGKLPAVEYYKYLEPLAIRRPILAGYIKLIKLQNKLDEAGLFTDLEILIENIYIKLSKDKTAHNLHQLDRDINILNKIFKLEATRDNLAYYKENQIRFNPENLLQFIKIQAPLNKITLPPELNDPSFIEDVNSAITPAEEFYRLALERDTALVENLLGVMQKNKKDKAVLVCGGFHAGGIKKILEDKGISILTITPSITKVQGDCQEIYLRRMMDERIDPERMLAELGMETLRPPIATGPEGIKIGLHKELIRALSEQGIAVGEGLTPEEFLDILPLLRELYNKGGSIASLIEDAVRKYNDSLPERAERITLEIPAPAIAEPPAHIAYMGVPDDSPYYSSTIEREEGETVPIPSEGKTAEVDQQLLEGLELTDQEFQNILILALMGAERYPGADRARLRDVTRIALLSKSSHLAENHVGDGFIGINAYVLELYQKFKERFGKAVANNFIQFLLEHELVHELTDKGEEIESDLIKRDAERFVDLFGEYTDAIIDSLETTAEFIEWVKFYSYRDIATKSFRALNRTKYEEDLVQALKEGENTVQAAHLKIQDFKGEFNTRGEQWTIGHILGDVGLETIGFVLQRFINMELERYGAKAVVYNQGPGFYIIFQDVTDPSIVKAVLEELVKKDSEFKRVVIGMIKGKLENVLPEEIFSIISAYFSQFTSDNLNFYGGISELQGAMPRGLEEAKILADVLDIQAIEIAKYAQLTINRDATQRYIEILARAARILREGRIEEQGHEIDEGLTELLKTVRNIPASNIEQYDTATQERVNVSKAYVLNREYTSFHIPMQESYKPTESFEELFREYGEAVKEGDFEKIRRIQKVIAAKTVTYKDTRIYYGNQRFKDTINYIIRNRPKVSLRLTFRIGGDEYGKLVWDAESKVLRILRFDGNNIGATTFQHGREIGDKVIDEQLRIIHETEDISKIAEEVHKIDAPDVIVTYRGATFQSRPMVSIGEVVVDTTLIPEDELDRDYSVIQGRADDAANKAKERLKHYQSSYNGQIDTKLTYKIAPAFAKENIPSFREYALPKVNSETAEFIVKSNEIRIVAGEIAQIIGGIEAKEIEEAILRGLEGRERIDIMELLNLAKTKGLNPEQVFSLAVRISRHLDKLLGKEAKEKGDEVIEAILRKTMDKIPEGIPAREQFINTLRQALKKLGISEEEIESELELIEMGLHIIAFDPLLNVLEIDASYFDFITQLAQMSGIDKDRVVKAFTEEYFSKQVELLIKDLNPETRAKITKGIILEELRLSDEAERLLFRKMSSDRYKRIQGIAKGNKTYFEGAKKVNPPGSELLNAVNRLKLYNTLRDRTNVDLDLEGVNNSFNNLDFPNGTVRREPVRYLSALQAVEGDLGKVFEPFLGAFQKEQPVFLSIPAGQFITEFLINESGGLEILHNPGLHAFINRLKQTRISFKLELRAKDENEKRLLDKVLEANPEFKDYLVTRLETDDLLGLRDSISSSYNIPRQNIVIITGEDFKPNDAITSAIRDNQLKIFGNTSESAFHAVLLFGVFFALTEKVVEDGRISLTVIEALRTLGVDENEINRISKGGLFFTVKLIRIKETLQEFQNRRLYVEVAA